MILLRHLVNKQPPKIKEIKMQAIVNLREFKKNLEFVTSIITKETLEFYKCVQFEADNQKLKLVASDECITIVKTMDCEVLEAGITAVSYTALLAYVTGLKGNDQVEIKSAAKLFMLTYRDRGIGILINFNYSTVVLPKRPEIENNHLEFKASEIVNIFSKLKNFMSKDPHRPILNSICLKVKKDHLLFVACDGKRVGEIYMDKSNDYNEADEIVINKDVVNLLLKEIDTTKNRIVKIFFTRYEYTDFFIDDNIIIRIKSCLFKYPNYEKVIDIQPNEIVKEVELNKLDLLEALKICTLTKDLYKMAVRMKLSNNSNLALFNSSLKYHLKTYLNYFSEAEITAKVELPVYDNKIGDYNAYFCPTYMIDILYALEGNIVKIAIIEKEKSKSPLFITEPRSKNRFLLMPLRS